MKPSFRLCFIPLALGSAGLIMPPMTYAINSSAVQILLNRAIYWQRHGRNDLAFNSWNKVLEANPDQAQALAGIALYDAQVGKLSRSRSYLERLEAVSPNNPAIAQINGLLSVGPGAGPELAHAAHEAAAGNNVQALSIYRSVFKGSPPPKWANTYYQTLAKVPGGWQTAIDELRVQAAAHHNAKPYRLVLGQLLTYHVSTRLQGITILARLGVGAGSTASAARTAWRQALIWMGEDPVAIPDLEKYLAHYSDAPIHQQLEKAIVLRSRINDERTLGQELRTAYADLNAGHVHQAASKFGTVLRVNPLNAKAQEGLGDIAMREKRYDLAADDYQRARKSTTPGNERIRLMRLANNAHYWHSMRIADHALNNGSYPAAIRAYRQALAFEPNSPGALAGLAGLYRQTGHKNKADLLFQHLAYAKPRHAQSWLYALQSLARLGAMRQVLSIQKNVPMPMRAILTKRAAYQSVIAQAEAGIGKTSRAIARLKSVIRKEGATPSASLQLQLGWLLYHTGHTRALHTLLLKLEARHNLTKKDRQETRDLYFNGARREAQRAIKKGHPQVALAILANLKNRFPDDPAVQRARAAIFVQEGHFHQAVGILRKYGVGKSAGDYELGIGAALADQNTKQAALWLKDGQARYPHNIALAQMAAHLNLREDHVDAARNGLKEALASLPMPAQTISVSPRKAQEYPFAGDFLPTAPKTTSPGLPSSMTGVSATELAATRIALEQQLIEINTHTSPYLSAAMFGRSRSGTTGLGQEDIFGAQIEASTVLGYNTHLTARLAPIALDAGSVAGPASSLIGTAPIYGAEPGTYANAAGLALAVTLSQPQFGMTIGSSPLGFPVHSIIADLRWQPAGGELALHAFRRDVTDSVLSYAGIRDPNTGLTWGGVFANGIGMNFGSTRDHHTVYSSLSFATLDGENVESNGRVAANVGASWPIVDQRLTKIGLGFDVLSMFYQRNLSNFTYGQGGYFSPQYYFRPSLTTSWRGQSHSRFFYGVKALLGWQIFYESSSPYFPTDRTMQAQSLNAYYPSQTVGNIGYGLRFTGAYAWTRHVVVGGFVHSDNSQNYTDLAAGLFIRYSLAARPTTGSKASSAILQTPWLLGLDRPNAGS